jgi:hypothetical protein
MKDLTLFITNSCLLQVSSLHHYLESKLGSVSVSFGLHKRKQSETPARLSDILYDALFSLHEVPVKNLKEESWFVLPTNISFLIARQAIIFP